MPYSMIDIYVILLQNLQNIPTFQGWKLNQRMPLSFQGCNFIQIIPLEFQVSNHQTLHLRHNQQFYDPNVFATVPIL